MEKCRPDRRRADRGRRRCCICVGVVTRGLGSDPVRVPWGNMYEFTLTGSLGVSVIYLVLLARYDLRWMGLLVTGFAGRRADARRAGALQRTPARWCPRCTRTGW